MLWLISIVSEAFFVPGAPVVVGFYFEIKEVSKSLSLIHVHWSFFKKLCSPCWEPQWIRCVLLNHIAAFTAFKMAAPWRYPPFFFIRAKKNYTFFFTKQMYPTTNPQRSQCWRGLRVFFFVFFPKTLLVMISPEAAEKGFHQREQETMHFKYSAKISEEIDEGGHTQLH